jgi:hypothetical protein
MPITPMKLRIEIGRCKRVIAEIQQGTQSDVICMILGALAFVVKRPCVDYTTMSVIKVLQVFYLTIQPAP